MVRDGGFHVQLWGCSVALLLLSVILIVTIIGILPGLGAISVFLLLGDFVGGKRLECPQCEFKNNFVMYGEHNVTCRKCKQNIAIDWMRKK